LETRKQNNALRQLSLPSKMTDFASNDYLGFSKNEGIFDEVHQLLLKKNQNNGATGSRLLSGNHKCIKKQKTLLPVSTIQKPR
jgi:8-amino-7-oxononanoate synthase